MAVLRPHPKCSPSSPANQGSGQAKTLAPRPVRTNVPSGPRPLDEQPRLLVESDLSAKMAVGDDELDAIIHLLGSALDDILSGTAGE
jgi:hypothetical protein